MAGKGGDGDAADATGGCCSSIIKKLGLRPVTRCSLATYYLPALGAVSYTATSVHVINPSLFIRVFPKWDITNLLLASTLVGTGSYIYTRKHMKSAPQTERILYSVTGAALLSTGSILLWAMMHAIVPPSSAACTIVAVGTGVALLKIGTNYLEFVDRQIAEK